MAYRVIQPCADYRSGKRYESGEMFDPPPEEDQAVRLIKAGCLKRAPAEKKTETPVVTKPAEKPVVVEKIDVAGVDAVVDGGSHASEPTTAVDSSSAA